MIGAPLERIDERRRAQRRAGQRAQHRDDVGVERVETLRLQCVRGQRADDFVADLQRATHAGMDAVVRVQCADDRAVERIRKI